MAISHLNPFVTTYKTLISDSFYHNLSIMQSTDRATPYGPLFVIISAGLCSIFKYNLIATIFSFKLFFFLITILCAYLVYRHFGKKAFYLLAFNPLLLFELIVNGHNESLVILFILLTFIFFKKAVKNNNRTYYLFSFAALMAAILIKYTALLILPFFYLLSLHNISTTRQRLKYSLSLFLLGSLMIILSYLPFDLNIFKSLKSVSAQSNISSALLCSPLILFFRGATHYLSFNNYNLLAVTVSRLVFLFFYIYLIGRARISQASKDPNKLTITFIKFSTLAFVGICASFFTWFMPWYLCSLLLTLIIFATNPENSSRQEKLLIASIYLISIYGLLFYFFLG
ncbi:MAG: glycosyltransferase family 39 protein [Candidatus Falkowbacteria bacterium]